MKLSVLMPARNAAQYLGEAIDSLESSEFPWELIVVDDHSTDTTWEILHARAGSDPRIRPGRNPGQGKVEALNYAYTRCSGDIITTLDADDALDTTYFRYLSTVSDETDAFVRDYRVTDSRLRCIGTYRMSSELLSSSFDDVVSGLVSLPRATWTMRRVIADRVFPIPVELPFEDVWFSLIVKKNARVIHHPRTPMYFYRQHHTQTFGGVLNYRPDTVRFRADRLQKYATLLPDYASRFGVSRLPDMSRTLCFYRLMAEENLKVMSILSAPISKRARLKLFVFRKLWFLLSAAKRVQWVLANARSGHP